jgi:hypothetical protein
MELPVQPSSRPSRGRNFESAPWCYVLWGVPVVLVIGAGIAYGESVLSLTARGVLWVTAVLGGNRLPHKRPILRESPLQNRRNPLSTPQHHRRVERALGHLGRLEPVLARLPHDPGRELCSRMDLEQVLVSGKELFVRQAKPVTTRSEALKD